MYNFKEGSPKNDDRLHKLILKFNFIEMKKIIFAFLLSVAAKGYSQTFAIHPGNKHLFEYQKKPLILIGSGEHYGAVLNLDFDFNKYLATLKKDGLNIVRIFTGPYREGGNAFGITRNTLAPKSEMFICPWKRTAINAENSEPIFNLENWDTVYFKRLHLFMQQAEDAGVIVELCLFTSYYDMWEKSPFCYKNNINNTENVNFLLVQTSPPASYRYYQELYIKKIVAEMNPYDNFYFEIQNEPWADNIDTSLIRFEYYTPDELKDPGSIWKSRYDITNKASIDWQRWVALIIRNEEKKLKKKHLISQNIGNFSQPVLPESFVGDFVNFHYAVPEAVMQNYYMNKPVGCNETGFGGKQDKIYLRQAWRFIISGGSLFNHLDYSFTVRKEDGSDTANTSPGGGSGLLRWQLGFLKRTIDKMDLLTLKPNNQIVTGANASYFSIADKKNKAIIYFESLENLMASVSLANGKYKMTIIDVSNGSVINSQILIVKNRTAIITCKTNYKDVVATIERDK